MYTRLLLLPLLLALLSGFQAPGYPDFARYPAAGDSLTSPCDSVPALNQQIVALVKPQIGKTVDRGECWDVAAMALNQTGAKWDKRYEFGRKADPEKECIYPGDFIQFEGVTIKYREGQKIFTETMGHHTAMIYEVKAKGVYVLAHQNTGTSGRKVGLSNLNLSTIVSGTYQVFRPVKSD